MLLPQNRRERICAAGRPRSRADWPRAGLPGFRRGDIAGGNQPVRAACIPGAEERATPPAFAGGKLYLGTADGRVLCVDAKNGKTLWESKVGGRIVFQPAVADGRIYVATDDGSLICLETGDREATGWTMWDGSANHNGAMPR